MESEAGETDKTLQFSSVIYLHVQAQCHCDQSDQTDKMQVIKLLWHPVI